MIIYCIENIISGKKYIGKTNCSLDQRIRSHLCKCKKRTKTKLYDAIRSYGFNCFISYIVDTADTNDDLNKKEIEYIKKLDTIKNGYNMVEGGTGGDTMSNHPNKIEIYKRVSKSCSIALKGKIFSKEHKINMGKARKGKKFSIERNKKISDALKGISNPNFGKHHSEETKIIIGLASRVRMMKICLTCKEEFYGGRAARYCKNSCKPSHWTYKKEL